MDRHGRAFLIFALAALGAGGCGSGGAEADGPEPEARDVFWSGLARLCGHAYGGRVAQAPAGDTVLRGKPLVMHVRECGADETRIAFHVGEDRSRTWVLTRSDSSLVLRHEHRHTDGSPAASTDYGGTTMAPGSATLQEFPADARTADANARASTNVWSIALDSARLIYGLDRMGTDRRFRIEFDVTDTVPTPPAPWGR